MNHAAHLAFEIKDHLAFFAEPAAVKASDQHQNTSTNTSSISGSTHPSDAYCMTEETTGGLCESSSPVAVSLDTHKSQ